MDPKVVKDVELSSGHQKHKKGWESKVDEELRGKVGSGEKGL